MIKRSDQTTEPERLTRCEEISADLAQAIGGGHYPVGSDLPSEVALCAQYGVSRFTVREALRRLTAAGLVIRRHGSGSRVIATAPKQSYILAVESESDVIRYAAETTMKLSTRVGSVSRQRAREFALGNPHEWVRLTGVRYSPTGERIGLVDVYLPAEHAAVATEIEQPIRQAIYSQVLDRLGLQLSSIEQQIGATTLTAGQARRLGAAVSEAALRIVRRYNVDGKPIEVSVHVHPASRFEYSLKIKPVGATSPLDAPLSSKPGARKARRRV